MADTGHDGSLQFDTGMDTSGFEAGSDKLLQSIQTLIDTVKTMGDSMQKSFSEMTPILQNLANTTGQIYAAMSSGAQQATEQQQAATAATQQQAQASQQAARAAQQQAQAQTQSGQAAQQAAQAAVVSQTELSQMFKAPQKDARQLESTMSKLDATVEKGFTSGAGVLKFVSDLQKAGVEVETLRKELDEIGNQTVKTEQYAGLEKTWESAVNQAEKYRAKLKELDELGVKHNNSRWLTTSKQLEAATAKAEEYRAALDSLEASGAAYTTVSNTTGEWQQLNALLQEAETKLAQHRDLIGAEEIEQAKLNARIAETNYLQNRGTEEEAAALQRLLEAREQLNELAAQVAGKSTAPPEEEELRTIEKMEAELQALIEKRDEMKASGNTYSAEYEETKAQIREIRKELEQTNPRIVEIYQNLQQWKAELKELEARGFGPGYAQYDDLAGRIRDANAEIKEYNASAAQTVSAGDVFGKIATGAKNAGSALLSFSQSYVSTATQALGRLGSAAAGAVKQLMKIQLMTFKGVFDGIAKGAKAAVGKIRELATRAKKATPNVNALAKALTSFKRMLVSRFKRMFISYVVTEIKNAFSALVKFSSDFDQAISGIRNTTSELAGNIAASLEDLINAIAPVIQSFISGISTAVTYLSALFGMLGGKKTITVAKKQTASYADSLRDTADAAKEAEGSLASFDTLTTIDDGSDSKAGADAAANDGSDRFEEVPIDSILPEDVQDWFGKIKIAFDTQDWEGIGDLLADKVNEWIDKLKKLLEGDELKKKAEELARALADLINGFVKGVHWRDLGQVLAEGLNLLLNTLNEFLEKLDTGAWGRAAADLINGFIEKFDWSLLGETLGNFCNRIIDFFWEFLTGTNWVQLGEGFATSVNTFLHTVEWEKLGMTVGAGLNAIVNTVYGFVHNTEWETLGGAFAAAFNGLFNQINWGMIGTTFAEGLNGIVDAVDTFVSLTDWTVLGQGFADMLIKAIEETDFADIGRTLAHTINAAITTYATFEEEMGPWFTVFGQKLANGINTAIATIDWAGLGKTLSMHFLTDAISGFLQDLNYSGIGESIGTTFDSWFNNVDWDAISFSISTGVNGILDIIDGFLEKTHWDEYGTELANQINQVFAGIEWDHIGTTLGDSVNEIVSGAFNLAEGIDWYSIGQDIATTASNFFSTVDWSQIFNMLFEYLAGLYDILIGFFENIDWVQMGQDIIHEFSEIDWGLVYSHVTEAIGSAFGALLGFITGIFSGVIGEVVQWWNDHAFEDGEFSMSKLFDGILTGLGDIAKWVIDHIFTPFITGVKKAFGIESPSKEMSEVGGYISEGMLNGVNDPFKSISNWVKTHIFEPFTKGVKSLFGISSPSKEMESVGGYIGEGLLNGVNDPFSNIHTWLDNHIFTPFTKGIKSLFGIASPSKETDELGGYTIAGFLNGVADGFDNIHGFLDKTIFKPFMDGLKSLFGISSPAKQTADLGEFISAGMLEGVKKPFGSIREWLNSNVFTPFMTGIKSLFGINSPSTVMQEMGKYIIEGLKAGVINNWNGFATNLTSKWSGLKNQLQNTDWKTVGSYLVSGLSNGVSSSWHTLESRVRSLASSLIRETENVFAVGSPSKVFEEIGGFLDAGLANGIDGGAASVLRTAKNLAENVVAQGEDISPDLAFNGDTLINGLAAVSDKLSGIATSLANITSYLDRVGGLQIPAIAAGAVIPYKTRAVDDTGNTGVATQAAETQGLLREIITRLTALENKEITATTPDIYLDGTRVTRIVANNANRMTVAAGKSVFIV